MRVPYTVIVALVVSACVRITDTTSQQQSPVGPSTPQPSANPSGGPTPPPVATVRVGEYTGREGVNCGSPLELRMGCTAFVTCTPRDLAGNDVGSQYVPVWDTLGSLTFDTTSINFYNGRARCDGLGLGAVSCEVGGVTGIAQLTCVP